MGDTIVKWLLNHKLWLAVLVIGILVLIVPSIVYDFMTIDPELWDDQQFVALRAALKKEQTEFIRPERTAVNSTDEVGKRFKINLSTRYRTELSKEEFRKSLDATLVATGWTFVNERHDYGTLVYIYCRGNLDAELIDEGSLGIYGDGGKYWKVTFKAGWRNQPFWSFPFLRKSTLPTACQQL